MTPQNYWDLGARLHLQIPKRGSMGSDTEAPACPQQDPGSPQALPWPWVGRARCACHPGDSGEGHPPVACAEAASLAAQITTMRRHPAQPPREAEWCVLLDFKFIFLWRMLSSLNLAPPTAEWQGVLCACVTRAYHSLFPVGAPETRGKQLGIQQFSSLMGKRPALPTAGFARLVASCHSCRS